MRDRGEGSASSSSAAASSSTASSSPIDSLSDADLERMRLQALGNTHLMAELRRVSKLELSADDLRLTTAE